MTDWLLVTIATALVVEVFLRTPFKRLLGDLLHAAQRARETLSSKFISDHWKEAVLPNYAFTIFRSSVLLFGCLLLAISPVIVIDLVGEQFGLQTISTMATGWGILYSTLVAIFYSLVRAQIMSRASYSPTQKLLHYLALSNANIGEATFAAEMRSGGYTAKLSDNEKHVFVSGMARAGTTILMRSIYNTGHFASLTYGDMPFVLAPNLWNRIAGKNKANAALKERAHGDGILVSFKSPEALDEVFWQVFTKNDYVTEEGLRPYQAAPEVVRNYQLYVSAIMAKYGKNRYISKNNNNILRFEAILSGFPNATMLIPFRDPLQQAFSLLKQHKLFQAQQREDPFVKRYMAWLGHYEFGLAHKPFNRDGSANRHTDTESIDYWLEQWDRVYRFLLDQTRVSPGNVIFVSYEALCKQPESIWERLCSMLSLGSQGAPELKASISITPQPKDRALLSSAKETYASLDRKCRKSMAL